jgi:flagellar biosynthesis protein
MERAPTGRDRGQASATRGTPARSGNGSEAQNRPTRRHAVALSYDAAKMPAPTVSAIGYGLIADRIVEIAQEHDVPIRPDPDLSSLLTHMEVGQIIPPELYPLVAEVLAFVYRLRRRSAVGSK